MAQNNLASLLILGVLPSINRGCSLVEQVERAEACGPAAKEALPALLGHAVLILAKLAMPQNNPANPSFCAYLANSGAVLTPEYSRRHYPPYQVCGRLAAWRLF